METSRNRSQATMTERIIKLNWLRCCPSLEGSFFLIIRNDHLRFSLYGLLYLREIKPCPVKDGISQSTPVCKLRL